MRPLVVIALVQLALGGALIALVLTGSLDGDDDVKGGEDGSRAQAAAGQRAPCPRGRPPAPRVDRVDEDRAFARLASQVRLGPRPAGSRASRRLAARLRRALPGGRFEPVPGGLRNVVGVIPGREPSRKVVLGAHYDTKDIPGFVGANDAAGGVAAVVEIARTLRRRPARPTVEVILFDGEESPRGASDDEFEERGLRGSRVAARTRGDAEAMVLLDFIADRNLSLPREELSDPGLWARLRAAARRVGVGCAFPARTRSEILDDHLPFIRAGVPSIDLIDFDFPCWHRRCDDMSAVSKRSLDASAEAVYRLLATL